jgi:RND family efflux transporter MFP subunit
VQQGQRVSATLDAYPNRELPAKVRTVIPTADRQKATVKVRISFDKLDDTILPDMGVKVAFMSAAPPPGKNAGTEARAIIPKTAVHSDGGKQIVYLVRDQKLERRAVSLGAERGNDVEILAGLAPGDKLVVSGAEKLHEGQTVEVKQ